MSVRNRSRRTARFIAFRVVPLILIVAILWAVVGVIQAYIRRIGEQVDAEQRASIYPLTATVLAPTLMSPSAKDGRSISFSKVSGDQSNKPAFDVVPTATPLIVAQAFATNTPRAPELPSMNTSAAPLEVTPAARQPPIILEATRPLPTVMFLGDPDPEQVDVTAIPTRVEPIDRHGYDLFNVLLLGSDGEITNDGFVRTDTMIVLSINRTTGTVAMLSLPRDLFVYTPAWKMARINLTYARGQSGGWSDGTFELLRQMLLYNFGVNVHYYAMIDLSGFKEIIDTIGGVDVTVDCAIEDLPLVGAEVPSMARRVNEEGYFALDVGYYHLTGAEALWYARSRYNSTDFDRGRRQQQILRAIWRKTRNTGELANLPQLWGQVTQVIDTNLGFEDMLGLLPIALNLNPSSIENFALTRTYHTLPWQTPDGDYVQLPLYDTLRPLLEDFYQPPTESQIVVEGAQIRVLNGTNNADWDRVAADRLGWSGLSAIPMGTADRTDYVDTTLVDYTGQSKGSSRDEIASILNIKPENILVNPDPNREVDFEVILGSSYNSCTFAVLPVGESEGE
jgi:polyisoprenyl-teichoic acid--peptidoglycan teichoic acid transferase